MAKNKVPQHVNQIAPTVNTKKSLLFDKLKQGECFLMNDSLYMKESGDDQIGVNLATGKYEDSLCGIQIIPVTITITWKKK